MTLDNQLIARGFRKPYSADCPQDLPGYTLGQIIGVGGFCQVRLATHNATARIVAVKIVEKNQVMKVSTQCTLATILSAALIIQLVCSL